ncbi:excinuclease ABC subunit UvrB [bacterium]|nr:excinuclease ABC subunit UvrB [bacterium]
MSPFHLEAPFKPAGDQPKAIGELVEGFDSGIQDQVLMGVTGSGKTFTVSSVIQSLDMPTIVLTHNKTLAAQLFEEFKGFFPHDNVGYFVSYYDYYQPEAYLPHQDKYIEKDAQVNDEVERLRHHAVRSLLTGRNAIIVATVSAIYGLGSPQDHRKRMVSVEVGDQLSPSEWGRRLVSMGYEYEEGAIRPGTFQRRGDGMDVHPSDSEQMVRIEFFGAEVDRLVLLDPLERTPLGHPQSFLFLPATLHTVNEEAMESVLDDIKEEMEVQERRFLTSKRYLEAERIRRRTLYDIASLENFGTVKGIENYSRHFQGRRVGVPPPCLLDYFEAPFLTVMDESHVSVPQFRGMVRGDRSRKETLVEHGFRLPSALDNRPLTFEELREATGPTLFLSATPGDWERAEAGRIVEQLIRPTYLVDPHIEVRTPEGQMEDLLREISKAREKDERVLVIALTQRMAEEIASFLQEKRVRAGWIHAEVETLERIKTIHQLRAGRIDVLVGINLLREGIDMPEVSLVAILDADKQGFLRSTTSLVQIMGRAARHVSGRVILYAEQMSDGMRMAIGETQRRRKIQSAYNDTHDITPKSILKPLSTNQLLLVGEEAIIQAKNVDAGKKELARLEREMLNASDQLAFELAASYRDRMEALAIEIAKW